MNFRITSASHTQSITTVNDAINITKPEQAIKNNRKCTLGQKEKRTLNTQCG
jgi:hypothetical protein